MVFQQLDCVLNNILTAIIHHNIIFRFTTLLDLSFFDNNPILALPSNPGLFRQSQRGLASQNKIFKRLSHSVLKLATLP